MVQKIHPLRVGLALVLAAACMAAGSQPVNMDGLQLAQASAPSSDPAAVEAGFWTLTQRLGTADAYRTYLAAYPNGAFAKLATAALQTGGTASSKPTSAPSTLDFRAIAADADSGAIEMRHGDVFTGPGPVSVGWRGSTKQLLIPTGPWVLLASRDFYSGHAQRIQLSSVALGQFEGSSLRSLLAVTFNSRAGHNTATWVEAQRCEVPEGNPSFAWTATGSKFKQCVQARVVRHAEPAQFWKGEMFEAVHRNLSLLNAVPQDKQALRSNLYITDTRKADMMTISRFDFGAPLSSPAVDSSAGALDLQLSSREAWMKAYAESAVKGFFWEIEVPELLANKPTAAAAVLALPK